MVNSRNATPIIKSAGEVEINKLQLVILFLQLKKFLKFIFAIF